MMPVTEATPNEEATPPEPEVPPEPVAEEKPSAEAKPEEGAEETGEAAAGETPEQAAEAERKHKRTGGWQRANEKLRRERDHLAQQLAQYQTQTGEQPAPAAPKEKTPQQRTAEYLDQLVEQRLQEREAREQQARAVAEFQRRASEVKARHPDFDEVVDSSEAPISVAVREAILTSDHGPEIMYQLAANPAELARISALPPLAAAREIGRLEAQAASSTAAPKKPATSVRRPSTPAPIAPVTARGPTSVKRPEDMSYDEYSAWRSSQRKR